MKYDPSLYEDVVSQFFTDDVIKFIEERINTRGVRGSSIDLSPRIEFTDRMVDFAIQYIGLERKQQYTHEEMEKIATIQNILQNKAGKIRIELVIKRLENLSPEIKEQFPDYKSDLERYKAFLKRLDEQSW